MNLFPPGPETPDDLRSALRAEGVTDHAEKKADAHLVGAKHPYLYKDGPFLSRDY
jgi:hypothetical protein